MGSAVLGTNSMIKESGLKIFPFGKFESRVLPPARARDRADGRPFPLDRSIDGLDEAAAKAVEAAR